MIILVSCIIFTAACSGDDDSTSSPSVATTPAEVSAEFRAAAETTATSALLALSDFPEGWTQGPEDSDEPDPTLSEACSVLEAEGLPGDIAHANSNSFVGPADQEVTSGTSVFRDSAGAEAAFNDYVSTFEACTNEFVAAYRKALEDEYAAQGLTSEVSDLAVAVDALPESNIDADDESSYRLLTTLSYQGQPMTFIYDSFVFRQGQVLGYITYFIPGDPRATEGRMADILANNLAEADGSLR